MGNSAIASVSPPDILLSNVIMEALDLYQETSDAADEDRPDPMEFLITRATSSGTQ